MANPEKQSRFHLYAGEVLVGLIGLVLGVILHEAFHIVLHWDQIPHIGLFPTHSGAIAQIQVWLPPGYDLEGEETAAYLITLAVWIITIMIIYKIHDAEDRRSAAQILFPDDKDLQKMPPNELLKLVEHADPMQTAMTPGLTKDKKKHR